MAEKNLPDYVIDTSRDRPTGIRIPLELHTLINEMAENKYRTFNSMIVALLHDAVKRPESEVMFLRVYRKLLEMEKTLTTFNESITKLNESIKKGEMK